MTAITVISLSEISKAIPNITVQWIEENSQKFKEMLWELGGNIFKPYEKQEGLTHRNKFNNVVLCDRWVLCERLDKEWIESGYASREAKLEASGSKLVRDLDPYKYHKL